MQPYSRFLKGFCSVVALSLLLAAGISIGVDPYGIFGTPAVPGLTTAKTLNDHITKPYTVLRGNYETLIVGSSRSRDIFCQDLAALYPGQDIHCYNGGIANGDFLMSRRMVDHAYAVTPLKRLVIALDFFGFNAAGYTPFDKTDTERFLGQPGKLPGGIVSDVCRMLFSQTALTKAFDTVIHSRPAPVAKPAAASVPQTSQAAAAPPHNPFVGFYPAVLQFYHNYSFINPRSGQSSLDALRSLLVSCRRRGIETYALINPFHAVMFDVLRESGHWKDFIAWKLAVIDIVAEVNAEGPGPRIALWDFSGYNPVTTEPLLTDGALRKESEYFADTFHYKRSIGNLMLRRMIAGEETIPGFGRTLSPADAASERSRLESGHEAFARDNAAYINMVLGRAPEGGAP